MRPDRRWEAVRSTDRLTGLGRRVPCFRLRRSGTDDTVNANNE